MRPATFIIALTVLAAAAATVSWILADALVPRAVRTIMEGMFA